MHIQPVYTRFMLVLLFLATSLDVYESVSMKHAYELSPCFSNLPLQKLGTRSENTV
jgi:hypothetical protein